MDFLKFYLMDSSNKFKDGKSILTYLSVSVINKGFLRGFSFKLTNCSKKFIFEVEYQKFRENSINYFIAKKLLKTQLEFLKKLKRKMEFYQFFRLTTLFLNSFV